MTSSTVARISPIDALVDELLVRHYDPTYARSIESNFPRSTHAITVTPTSVSPAALRVLARELVDTVNEAIPEPTT